MDHTCLRFKVACEDLSLFQLRKLVGAPFLVLAHEDSAAGTVPGTRRFADRCSRCLSAAEVFFAKRYVFPHRNRAAVASSARDRPTMRGPPVSGAVFGDKGDSVPGPP